MTKRTMLTTPEVTASRRRGLPALAAVLLGLTLTLVGPAQPGRGHSHEDQDYYLQELLARERHGKMQVSEGGEEPAAASMPGPPETRLLRQTPADKKNPRGGKTDGSRSPEKQTAKSKSEKTDGGKAAKSKKGGLKSPNSSSERGGTEHSVPEGE
ncbi:unnamed protein product [Arctogadus glacialis]